MAQYNWSNLSDHDFEAVCRDLMAKTLGSTVEAFATGRDGGIDLRATIKRSLIIGQAKHYLRSDYADLLRSVRKEKQRLDELPRKPNRYILYTSASLSPAKKTELKAALEPYVRRTSDIVGIDDLEGQLVQHPSIEEHHYKLWLASARVLESILGNATRNRTTVRVEELLRKARLYVPHRKFADAQKILAEEHCLIVSGPAGIGKTTLAEMLTLKFLGVDFDVFFVATVDEIEQKMKPEAKQVFIYDDFLGRTNFKEAPDATSQERLFAMMRHIATKKNMYVILTTREYLYREAQAANDRLSESRADLMRCLLDVRGYSTEARAKILYNHLYWSTRIPPLVLKEFVTSNGHWAVIEHPNFNPRWIADCLDRIGEPVPSGDGLPWT